MDIRYPPIFMKGSEMEELQREINKLRADFYGMNLFLFKLAELLVKQNAITKKEYTILYNNHNIALKKDKTYKKLLEGKITSKVEE